LETASLRASTGIAGPPTRRQIANDLRLAGFRVPLLSFTNRSLSQLSPAKYHEYLGFFAAIRREIQAPGLLDLYLPSAAHLALMDVEFLTASRQGIRSEYARSHGLSLGNLYTWYQQVRQVAITRPAEDGVEAAAPTTPMPDVTTSGTILLQAGRPEQLLDVMRAEQRWFKETAAKPTATVDKMFHSLERGKKRLGFENVVVYRPMPKRDGETRVRWVRAQESRDWSGGESKYDPSRGGSEPDTTLKSVIEGVATVYDVDITNPGTFAQAGLVADRDSIDSDLAHSKGPGRLLIFKLVNERTGEVEAVVYIHNRVGRDEAIDPRPPLPADVTTADRVKYELQLYFEAFVRSVDTVKRRAGYQDATPAPLLTAPSPPPVLASMEEPTSTPRPDLVDVKSLSLAALPNTHLMPSKYKLIFLAVVSWPGVIVRLMLGRLGRALLPAEKFKLVDFFNESGQKIKAYLDYPEGVDPKKAPWVIVPPAFGKTKETTFYLALYLKKNGIGVLRYDDTCAMGESDGDICDLALSRSASNVAAAVNYLSLTVRPAQIGLVPFSLSARTSIKAAAALGKRIDFMMPIVGAPNLQSVLARVSGEDLVAKYRGQPTEPMTVLGHLVNGTFMSDALEKGFADLSSTLRDMEHVRCPIIWACGKDDGWIDIDEVRQIMAVNPAAAQREVIVCDGLGHRIKVAGKAPEIFAEVTRRIKSLATSREIAGEEIVHPSQSEIVGRAVQERRRIAKKISRAEEISNWTEYLKGFDALLMSDDYRGYLEEIVKSLALAPGDNVLDVGCGNGNLLTLILTQMAARTKGNWQKGKLAGVDFVEEALARTAEKTAQVRGARRDLPTPELHRVDMEQGEIPYPNRHFQTIVASLFLSYLQKPEVAVAKMCDKLAPGGKIVLTSLKPDADVSQIFFRFMDKLRAQRAAGASVPELESARNLLHAAMGWIEDGEESGHFKYHSAEALAAMLLKNGLEIVKTQRSFGNQAEVVVARKPN